MANSNFIQWINHSHAGRILLLGILIIVLQIPISSIESLVYERQATENQAVNDVRQKWGKDQRVVGPLLVVPYQVRRQWENTLSGVKETTTEVKRAVFLPDSFESSASLDNETRYRGIFQVPLYQADVTLSGSFSKPDFAAWDIVEQDVLWEKARLVVMVSDARAIQKQAEINWSGRDAFFKPGTDEAMSHGAGYHVELADFSPTIDRYPFSINMKLNGSGSLYVAPLGKDSLIKMQAPWPDPSFQGNWLPTSRKITKQGFTSQWQIPYLGRNFPQQSRDFKITLDSINTALVGVDLISPVDNYRMAERSIKYEMLFLVLTFVVIWMIELLTSLRVHTMQYLLIGVGLCLFYLLELSLSEHIGFYAAYAVATLAIVGLVTAYSYVVLKTRTRAAIIGGSLVILYLYLFTLLQEQNFALLIGSIGLFILLAGVMYVTRKIDWFSLTQSTDVKAGAAEAV